MSSPSKQRRTVKNKRKNVSPIKLQIENTETSFNILGRNSLELLEEFDFSTESFLELPNELQMEEIFLSMAIQKNKKIFEIIPSEKKTQEFVLSLIKDYHLPINSILFEQLPSELMKNPEFIVGILDFANNPAVVWSVIPRKIKTKELIISCIQQGVDRFILSDISNLDEFTADDLKQLVQANGSCLQFIINSKQMNEDILFEAVKTKYAIENIDYDKRTPLSIIFCIKHENVITRAALKRSVDHLLSTGNEEFFSRILNEEPLFLPKLLTNEMSPCQLVQLIKKDLLNLNYYFERTTNMNSKGKEEIESIWFSETQEKLSFENFLKRYPNHKRVAQTAVEQDVTLMNYVSDELKSDVGFCLRLLDITPKILHYVLNEARNNYELNINALMLDFGVLNLCSDELKEDIQFWIALLKKSPRALFRLFPEKFRGNIEIASLAIKGYPMNLEFVSNDLKNNMEIVMMAVLEDLDLMAFQLVPNELTSNKEFIRKLLSNGCWRCLKFCASELRSDKKFMLEAIKLCNECAQFLPLELLDDKGLIGQLAIEAPGFLRYVRGYTKIFNICLSFNPKCLDYINRMFMKAEMYVLACGAPFRESLSNWSFGLYESGPRDAMVFTNPLLFDKLEDSDPLKSNKKLICRARGYFDSKFSEEFLEKYLNRPNWFIFDNYYDLMFIFREYPQNKEELSTFNVNTDIQEFTFSYFNGDSNVKLNDPFTFEFGKTSEFKVESNFKFEETLFTFGELNLNDELKHDFN